MIKSSYTDLLGYFYFGCVKTPNNRNLESITNKSEIKVLITDQNRNSSYVFNYLTILLLFSFKQLIGKCLSISHDDDILNFSFSIKTYCKTVKLGV